MATPARKILVQEDGSRRASPAVPSTPDAWKAIGWFGLLLLVIGLGDVLVNWYPLGLGSPEWEFATIGTSFGLLPVVTMGAAAILGSFLARGVRWGIITMTVAMVVLGLLILSAYGVFLLDVPLALRSSAGSPQALAVRRAIARTTILGVGFSVGYLAGAAFSLRSLKRRTQA